MQERTRATRLRIYLGEQDRWHGQGLAWAIICAARDHGLAGATVLQGIEGYGAERSIHTQRPFSFSSDLPLMVEIIDVPKRIEAFLPVVESMLGGGLATTEPVEAIFYRRRQTRARPTGQRARDGRAGPGPPGD
jgi:hypothetical protein